ACGLVDAIWMSRRGSSWAARNAPMVTSQAAVGSGRPRRSPATVITAATSSHKTAHPAVIEPKDMGVSFVRDLPPAGRAGVFAAGPAGRLPPWAPGQP